MSFFVLLNSWLNKLVILVFIVCFLASGIVLNLVQLSLLPLYWISRYTYRVLNARIVYFHWALVPWALESWAGYNIRIFGIEDQIKQYANTEHGLCVLNHRGDMDWMIGWCIIDRFGMLGGVKAIMKDVAKYVPGIGWMFLLMEYPILKRRWEEDEERLTKSCRVLSDYPVNMLLCLFAEGTRFTEEKHQVSMKVAREKGLKELKHHLLPRKKGFVFLVNHLKVPAIYDVTIAYREGTPSMIGVIDRISCSCDIAVRRIPMSEVPMNNEEDTANYLYTLYQEKDELIEYHKQNKTFPKPFEENTWLGARPWPKLVFGIWLTLLGLPLVGLFVYLLWSSSWYILAGLIAVVTIIHHLFFIIVKLTDVKNASTFGLKKD